VHKRPTTIADHAGASTSPPSSACRSSTTLLPNPRRAAPPRPAAAATTTHPLHSTRQLLCQPAIGDTSRPNPSQNTPPLPPTSTSSSPCPKSCANNTFRAKNSCCSMPASANNASTTFTSTSPTPSTTTTTTTPTPTRLLLLLLLLLILHLLAHPRLPPRQPLALLAPRCSCLKSKRSPIAAAATTASAVFPTLTC